MAKRWKFCICGLHPEASRFPSPTTARHLPLRMLTALTMQWQRKSALLPPNQILWTRRKQLSGAVVVSTRTSAVPTKKAARLVRHVQSIVACHRSSGLVCCGWCDGSASQPCRLGCGAHRLAGSCRPRLPPRLPRRRRKSRSHAADRRSPGRRTQSSPSAAGNRRRRGVTLGGGNDLGVI